MEKRGKKAEKGGESGRGVERGKWKDGRVGGGREGKGGKRRKSKRERERKRREGGKEGREVM
jgi:hypothetical protein